MQNIQMPHKSSFSFLHLLFRLPVTELLRALNMELESERERERETERQPDYGTAVELASKFDMLKKIEQDLRAEQELVDKSALLMKMLEVSEGGQAVWLRGS